MALRFSRIQGGGQKHIISTIDSINTRLSALESHTNFIKHLIIEGDKDSLNNVFNTIYKTNAWASGSGPGSDEILCADYVAFLQGFFKQRGIKSIVDCGCGDWQFSKNIDFSGISYKGFDVADFVIKRNAARYKRDNVNFFLYNGDFSALPSADLIICKDVLQHLPNAKIQEFINNLRKFRFALITNDISGYYTQDSTNIDIIVGDYRALDLRQEPFNLPCKVVHSILRMPNAPDMLVMLWENPKNA